MIALEIIEYCVTAEVVGNMVPLFVGILSRVFHYKIA